MQKCSRQTCEWRRSFVSFSMKKYVNMTKISEIKRWSSGKSKKQCSGNSPDSKIALWKGDITKLQIDAIVNAANKSLLGGGGVDGAIHAAAGPDLLKECKTLNGCETGKSKITKGYKLPSKHVIHTVGPIGENRDLLKSCYENSLNLLRENNLQSIAFPCISTGIFGYPNKAAAKVALKTTSDWLKSNFEYVDLIVFCLFMPVDVKIYNELAEKYFPIKPNDKVPQKQVETLSKTTENGNEPQRTRKSEPDMKNENDPKKVKSDTDVSSSGGKNYSKEGAGSRDKKNKSASNPPVATGEGIGEINADTVDEGLGEDKFRSLEDSHRDKLIVRDTEKWMLNRKDETIFPLLKRVGGLDISYHITDKSIACVTAVVLSYPDMKVIYESTSEVQITAPYKAGYLAHRELIPCRDKLKELIGTEHEPQIVLVDGNGMLHHRRFGNASFTGVACDIPTIGVAKNLLFLPEEGIDRDEQHIQNIKKLKKKGDSFDIITKSGELIGKAVITSDNSHKPVYVSTGHRCSLETAVQVSVACSKFRIPEPIRAADKISNTYLRDHYTDDYDAYHKSKQKVSK